MAANTGETMTEEELYSLVEIADMLDTASTTIRYRASKFSEFLHPIKRPKQFRGVRHPASDIAVFEAVDRLYKEGRSTGDIRRALADAQDDRTIDAIDDGDAPSPPARVVAGSEAMSGILREAMAPINDSNRQIAKSLETLQDLLSSRGAGGDSAEVKALRQRVRELEEDNRRLRRELEQTKQSLPRRLLRRARSML